MIHKVEVDGQKVIVHKDLFPPIDPQTCSYFSIEDGKIVNEGGADLADLVIGRELVVY